MEKARAVYKMFLSQDEDDYDGFFCIYESLDSFFGYRIQKEKPQWGICISIGEKEVGGTRYINCDQMYEFPKKIRYKKLETKYNLRDLREVIKIIPVKGIKHKIIDGKHFGIKEHGSFNSEKYKNRRNPEYHRKLKEARILQERAIMNNDKDAVKKYDAIIEELNDKLGYHERRNNGYKVQMKDTVTNLKPLRGGSCTPK